MKLSTLAITALVTSFAVPALAQKRQPPPQAFRDKYFDAETAYRLGELRKAEKLYKEAGKLYKAAGVHRGLAAVYADLADTEKSQKGKVACYKKCLSSAFLALKIAPTSRRAKETRALYEDCRHKLGRPSFRGEFQRGQGVVAIVTDVLGAQVKINGNLAGATPMRPRPVNSGRAVVEVKVPGRGKLNFVVDILEGVVTDIMLDEELRSRKRPRRG